MWTNKNRSKYKRDLLRYPSDLTDEEWAQRSFIRRGGHHAGKRDPQPSYSTFPEVKRAIPTSLGRLYRQAKGCDAKNNFRAPQKAPMFLGPPRTIGSGATWPIPLQL